MLFILCRPDLKKPKWYNAVTTSLCFVPPTRAQRFSQAAAASLLQLIEISEPAFDKSSMQPTFFLSRGGSLRALITKAAAEGMTQICACLF